PYTLSDVAFSRVDARLQEHVREARPRGFRWVWAAGLIGAAAAFAFLVLSPQRPAPAAFEPMAILRVDGETSLKEGELLGRGARVDAERASVSLATVDGE